jgi:hypothetical protein
MCISVADYIAARVTERLIGRGVDRARAEAVGRKVAARYGDRRNQMYLAYLAGVEVPRSERPAPEPPDPIPGQLSLS